MKDDLTTSRIWSVMLVLTAVAALNVFQGTSVMAMDVQIENTFLEVTVASETGRMSVLQKGTGTLWEQELPLPNPHSVSDLEVDTDPNVIRYSLTVVQGQTQPLELTVELALIGDEPAIDITLTSNQGDGVSMQAFGHPTPLYPPSPEQYFMAVPDYCNGRYVPVSDSRYRNRLLDTRWALVMPWVAVTDGEKGMIVVATSVWSDSILTQFRQDDQEMLGFPGMYWLPSKGMWAGSRNARLVFFETGGYVTACKIYRDIAQQSGNFRTLADKANDKPNLHKLMGSVDWWGAEGPDQGWQGYTPSTALPFVKEAVAEGVDRGMVTRMPQRGTWTPEDIAEIDQLGWLVGEYDNYSDFVDSDEIAFQRGPVEEHAHVQSNGEFLTGWIIYDDDMNPILTMMHRCSTKYLEWAQAIIPETLQTYPYNSRFVDLVTSQGIIECYSPSHPTTRDSDVANRRQLLSYISEDLGPVLGSETGRFWGTPYVDYHMGMMSGDNFLCGWNITILDDIKDRSELGALYLQYAINPMLRAPLFELVYHDCVVDYWWYGDSSEFLHGVAPELTDRKAAMNILYGTPPQMWPYEHGLHWNIPKERELMLTIYRNVCKLHEIIGMQEMVSHTFLTPDRMVQQSVFADGTTCTVNFGAKKYSVKSERKKGRVFNLGENDFYVVGPKIEQWRATDGKSSQQTVIRTDTYLSVESGATLYKNEVLSSTGTVTVKKDDAEQAHIRLAAGSSLKLDVLSWQPDWATLHRVVVRLNNQGQPIDRIKGSDSDIIMLATPVEKCSYLLLVGSKALAPQIAKAPSPMALNQQ